MPQFEPRRATSTTTAAALRRAKIAPQVFALSGGVVFGKALPFTMPLRPEFSLINSEFNRFLHAVVGEQENGLQITVLSTLTRAGLDPWRESARLRDLPPQAAAESLAQTILRLSAVAVDPTVVPQIASRLVGFLPKPIASPHRS